MSHCVLDCLLLLLLGLDKPLFLALLRFDQGLLGREGALLSHLALLLVLGLHQVLTLLLDLSFLPVIKLLELRCSHTCFALFCGPFVGLHLERFLKL